MVNSKSILDKLTYFNKIINDMQNIKEKFVNLRTWRYSQEVIQVGLTDNKDACRLVAA